MTKLALVGIQWGDEGKGKYVTYFINDQSYDVKVDARFNGGGNAGHTIFTPDGREVATHQVPSGIYFSGVYNAMLDGVLIEPEKLVKEIELVRKSDLVNRDNLGISGLAHVTLAYHLELENLDEQRRGKTAIGTTLSGIGPTAMDKYGRTGMRFAEFVNPRSFKELLRQKKEELEQKPFVVVENGKTELRTIGIDIDKYLSRYEPVQNALREFLIEDDAGFFRDNSTIRGVKGTVDWLYEGAQGMMLDPAFGSYPYVTSTHAGKAPTDSDRVIGVAKAYITRVGGGPLPTRMDEQTEALIRGEKGTTGAEFGATTGRPRSCGWFDVPVARHAINLGAVDSVALVKLDVLSRVPTIKVCTHYRCRDKVLDFPPADRFEFEQCTPVYKEVKSWPGVDITGVQDCSKLPQEARDYLKLLEDRMECKVSHVSVGPTAEQTIRM